LLSIKALALQHESLAVQQKISVGGIYILESIGQNLKTRKFIEKRNRGYI
jgi:hypothetical protein